MAGKTEQEYKGLTIKAGRVGIYGEYYASVWQDSKPVYCTGRFSGKGARDRAIAQAKHWVDHPPKAPKCHRCGKPVYREKVVVAKVGAFHHICHRMHQCGVPV